MKGFLVFLLLLPITALAQAIGGPPPPVPQPYTTDLLLVGLGTFGAFVVRRWKK